MAQLVKCLAEQAEDLSSNLQHTWEVKRPGVTVHRNSTGQLTYVNTKPPVSVKQTLKN